MSLARRLGIFVFIVALFVGIGAPRDAKACGAGGGTPCDQLEREGMIALGVFLVDLGVGIYDLSTVKRNNDVAEGMAVAEVAFTAPQVALVGYILASDEGVRGESVSWWIAAVPTALMIHGIVKLSVVDFDAERKSARPTSATRVLEPGEYDALHASRARRDESLHVRFAPSALPVGAVGHETLAPAMMAFGSF